MSHDELCPVKRETWCIWPGDRCQVCLAIARAREEVRAAALRDAIAAVREAIGIEWNGEILPKDEYDCCGCRSYNGIVNDATNAIEALGGER